MVFRIGFAKTKPPNPNADIFIKSLLDLLIRSIFLIQPVPLWSFPEGNRFMKT